MSDPLRQNKREGWLGLVLTAILCLGFLYWWFRPAREEWQPHSIAQLVARALAEPGLSQPRERLVIDLDLMETAILQARLGMIPESLETSGRIADPIVQARTIRQLAQAHLNQDARHLGAALGMCDRISDLPLRARMREEILLQIAMMGFPDVVLPEADSVVLRAKLARSLAETDGQETARTLLEEIEGLLPSMDREQKAEVLPALAWTRVFLAIVDGPQQAFPAIRRLPEEEQDELWLDLFRVCIGRGEEFAAADSAAVAAEIASPALRRQIELEALESHVPLRPAEVILEEIQTELRAALPGAPQVQLLLQLAHAQGRTAGWEAAAIPLKEALQKAGEVADAAERCRLLGQLAENLPHALLFAEAQQALTDAARAARLVSDGDERLPLLVMTLRHAFNSGEIAIAAALAEEALKLAPKVKRLEPPLLNGFAEFLTRYGDWPAAVSLLPDPVEPTATAAAVVPEGESARSGSDGDAGADPEAEKKAAIQAEDQQTRAEVIHTIANTAAEEAIGYAPSSPPNRGEPLDRIRNRAISDEAAAAAYLPGIPAGFPRARATLAIAKGLLLPPLPPEESGIMPDELENPPADALDVPSGSGDITETEEPDEMEPENADGGADAPTGE